MQVETQLARLVSLLDLKKATPKTSAPKQAGAEEQQHRAAEPQAELQTEPPRKAPSGGEDSQHKKVAKAHHSKKQLGPPVQTSYK